MKPNPRTRLLLATGIVVGLIAAIVLGSIAGTPHPRTMTASDVVADHPSGWVKAYGVVVRARASGGRIDLLVADEASPQVGVLRMRYSGPGRFNFGPRSIVVATGRLSSDGVFVVDDFITKQPGSDGA